MFNLAQFSVIQRQILIGFDRFSLLPLILYFNR